MILTFDVVTSIACVLFLVVIPTMLICACERWYFWHRECRRAEEALLKKAHECEDLRDKVKALHPFSRA